MSWLGRGGKDINFTQGGVGEDPRKEVGKKGRGGWRKGPPFDACKVD